MSYRCTSPESTFSKKSKDSTTSEPNCFKKSSTTLNFGRFLQGSYLDKNTNNNSRRYIKSPSCNPTIRENIPTHYHYIDGFSYRGTRSDMKKSPTRKPGATANIAPRSPSHFADHPPSPAPDKQQDVIQLSKLPDGHVTSGKPIERDDFPAPPHVAAVYPQLLRERKRSSSRPSSRSGGPIKHLSTGKENTPTHLCNAFEDGLAGDNDDDDDDDDEVTAQRRSRLEREIKELSKLEQSGAVRLILKDLQRKQHLTHDLDPRSASRTPSANREPPFKTRYNSPIYASPSRDLLLRSHLHHLDDDCELKYRTVVTPLPTSAGSRPRYHKSRSGYTTRDFMTSYKRPGSTDGCLEHSTRIIPSSVDGREEDGLRQCSVSVCERFSQYSSHSDLDDADPHTGLRSQRSLRGGMNGRLTPISLLSSQFYSIHRSMLTSMNKDEAQCKTYPYESLKVTSDHRPAHVDDEHLEQYLDEETFENILGMDRVEFYHLPAWKRNDIKKRVLLFK